MGCDGLGIGIECVFRIVVINEEIGNIDALVFLYPLCHIILQEHNLFAYPMAH